MQRSHGSVGEVANDRVVEDVDMEVQDVELIGHLSHLVEHDDVVGNGVLDARIKPQSELAAGLQAGGRPRISAGEQGHVMPLPD
jgi:hypothetical protein